MPTLAEVVESDDAELILSTLLKRIAADLDETESKRDVKALSVELRDTMKALDEVRAKARRSGKGSKVDELAKRRAARRSAAN